MNFRKSSERGGVIFNPKIYIAKFLPVNRAFWPWNWYKGSFTGYAFQQLYWWESKQGWFWRRQFLTPPPHPFGSVPKKSSVLVWCPFNLIASRRRCVCFWHINNQSLWSGIFVVQIYRGSLQIWFKIEQQSISVLWNLTVQHCKLYQNILNISWWRIVITNWNIGNDRVYFESMFASASFPSLVVGKWPCLLEIGSGRRNQQGNHGSKRFYFVCRWRTVCQQVPYIRGAQLWKFTRCPATVYQHTGLQKVDSSFCTLARKNSKIAKWTSPVSREAQLLQASVKIIQNFPWIHGN